jgi:two-component system cell cycle response regulator DivK
MAPDSQRGRTVGGEAGKHPAGRLLPRVEVFGSGFLARLLRAHWRTFCPPTERPVAKILIVEDSPDNMKLFRALLTARGHQVTGLAGGERLLQTLDGARPDLILMDIQLPGKDGFALLGEIRGSMHSPLRVVALTAHAMSGDRERALEAGFDGYITKPIDIRSFPQEVEQALGDGSHPF